MRIGFKALPLAAVTAAGLVILQQISNSQTPAGAEIVVAGYQAEDEATRAVGANRTYAADGKRIFLGGSAPGANGGGGENP